MKTVVIEWVETSNHKATVNVPVDVDDVDDLEDRLAELGSSGFEYLERSDVSWSLAPSDLHAETFLLDRM